MKFVGEKMKINNDVENTYYQPYNGNRGGCDIM